LAIASPAASTGRTESIWPRLGGALALLAIGTALALSLSSCGGGGAEPKAKRDPYPLPACTRSIGTGASLSRALPTAAPRAVFCLRGGSYPGARIPAAATDYTSYVTIRPANGQTAVFHGELAFDGARHLRIQALVFESGLAFRPAASHVELIDNELTGPGGIFFFGDSREGGSTRSILIEGNHIHDIDYSGPQAVYRGYGVKSIGTQDGVTVKGNTIESVAADYLQTDEARNWTVEGNTFLGPTLVDGHPQEHQDLWQVYGGGSGIEFTGNVARDTGTSQSLLFQLTDPGNRFTDVTVTDNLFDHDSRGYSCQIYQSNGLVFRRNTVVGSRWGCLFRRDSRFPGGSDYEVDHNVFVETMDGPDISLEQDVANWGSFDRNVSSDGSATGANSLRDWKPAWSNEVDFQPLGLPFPAGY
jgi:hypothetical protein